MGWSDNCVLYHSFSKFYFLIKLWRETRRKKILLNYDLKPEEGILNQGDDVEER